MKKIFLFCCVTLTLCLTSRAQPTNAVPEKELLIVDYFLRSREVPISYAETLRGYVLDACALRGRHRIASAEDVPQLTGRMPGIGVLSSANASSELGTFLNLRAREATDAGARYLISGALTDYKFEHAEIPSSDSKKPPRAGFRATFRIVLSALDLKLGTRLPDEPYVLTATASTAEGADRAALERIRGQLEYYIDRNFKFETTVLELCPPDKKGRVRELFIHSGTSMGVKVGDLFLVYEEVVIGGVAARQKIGRLRVNNAENTDVARCKITKGEDAVAKAFLGGRGPICISDGKAFGF